jgi:hypothetical protein
MQNADGFTVLLVCLADLIPIIALAAFALYRSENEVKKWQGK